MKEREGDRAEADLFGWIVLICTELNAMSNYASVLWCPHTLSRFLPLCLSLNGERKDFPARGLAPSDALSLVQQANRDTAAAESVHDDLKRKER